MIQENSYQLVSRVLLFLCFVSLFVKFILHPQHVRLTIRLLICLSYFVHSCTQGRKQREEELKRKMAGRKINRFIREYLHCKHQSQALYQIMNHTVAYGATSSSQREALCLVEQMMMLKRVYYKENIDSTKTMQCKTSHQNEATPIHGNYWSCSLCDSLACADQLMTICNSNDYGRNGKKIARAWGKLGRWSCE